MTLGPKLFCCSKMAVTRHRSKLWWRTAHQSKALVKTYLSTVSKHDLKPSGISIFSKMCMRPWIRMYPFSWVFAPGGRLSDEAYNVNYLLSKSKVPKM